MNQNKHQKKQQQEREFKLPAQCLAIPSRVTATPQDAISRVSLDYLALAKQGVLKALESWLDHMPPFPQLLNCLLAEAFFQYNSTSALQR